MDTQHQYITTTLPYVNADPHLGFALEIVQADVIARTWRRAGCSVVFHTGTDDHGLKIYRKSAENNLDPQTYVDQYAARFSRLKDSLDLSYTNFIRTSDPHHKAAAREFWRRCMANGDIYKKNYTVKYCVGCELEKTDSELVDGRCPLHPNQELELIEEENYFFRFSAYQQRLLDHYDSHPDFILPAFRQEEIRRFVADGLTDFSISRLASKMPWGVPVPDDEEQVMYVWFDALVNYISTLGWPEDEASFSQWWPGVQTAGKDNLRQQTAMWQAMLLSAGLPLSKQIIIHGFITADGKKMSKSVGNVIDPIELVDQYGTDAVRYYLLKEIPSLDDGDFSHHRMREIFSADLANELGNIIMRITTLGSKDGLSINPGSETCYPELSATIIDHVSAVKFSDALGVIWKEIKSLNKHIDQSEPWKKTPEEREPLLRDLCTRCYWIGDLLSPFLPTISESIMTATSGTLEKCPPLFPKDTLNHDR